MSALNNIDDAAAEFFDGLYAAELTPVSQMPDVMVDLETMGTRPNAPIVAIGAVTFDARKMVMGERFYCAIDLASSVSLGSVIDPGTVMWWMKQSDDARKALLKNPVHVCEALTAFASWLERCSVEQRARRIWGNSPSFDCIMLSEHYRKASLEVPWHFSNERDFRTFRNLWPNVEMEAGVGTHHNALDDAEYQVNHMFKIRRTLRANT